MQKLVIYVHAHNAVIRSVEIEITETLPVTSNIILNSIARDIAAQIERRFPKSQARDAMSGILSIIKHSDWIDESLFAGIALRVPGIIEEHTPKGGSSTGNTATVQTKIDLLTQQCQEHLQEAQNTIIRLEKELRTTQQQQRVLQTRLQQVQNVQKQTRSMEDELLTIKQQLEEKEQNIADSITQRNELLSEKGSLEMQLKQVTYKSTQQEEIANRLTTEIAELRRENVQLVNDNKELQRQMDKQQNGKSAAKTRLLVDPTPESSTKPGPVDSTQKPKKPKVLPSWQEG